MPDTPGTLNFPTSLDTAVSLFEVSNRAYTTMTGSIGTGDLSIGVANGSLLPSTGAVTLVDSLSAPTKVEHVIYTVNSSNTLTVPAGGRGFGGSTAQSWSGTVYVRARALAQHHSVLRGGVIALETKLGINSSTPSSGTILRGTGAGASDWGALVNADVSASAAIAFSKLAALTASRAVITDVSGVLSAATTTSTEIGYLNGVTSAIQTQIDAKQATFGSQTANTVYAGPTSGGAASPSFRALVSGDLPTHNQAWSTITSTPTTLSGYGITDAAANGAVTASGLTMATAKLLGRSTASTGAIEEITVGSGLTLSAGTLSASGGSGITIGTTTITSGTTTRVLFNNAGVVGEYAITGTGNVVLSASPTLTGTVAAAAATFSGTITQTSASATAFESGPNGGTNPVFRLVNSTASAATGISITGAAAGGGVAIQAISSGTNESLSLNAKGSGTVNVTSDMSVGKITASNFINALGSIFVNSTSNIQFNADTFIRRGGSAGTWVFGTTDAASPVAQTFTTQSATGTNIAGATTTWRGSLGTSQGVPGRIHVQGGAMIAASGSTQQTAVDRAIFNGTKVLTNNSAITIANVTAASGSNAGGQLGYFVEVTDGTDYQYEVGVISYGVTNKGGVFSGNTATKFGNHQNASSGTLTVTVAISGANPALLSVNANSSLTPSTGYPRITYWLMNGGHQSVAPQ